MKLSKMLTATTAAFLGTAGLAVAAPTAAHAGTSVPPTYNAGTGVTWAYYASTDNLCIKRPIVGEGGYIAHAHGSISAQNAKRGKWRCMNMKEAGAREDHRVKIFLHGTRTTPVTTSTTTITI